MPRVRRFRKSKKPSTKKVVRMGKSTFTKAVSAIVKSKLDSALEDKYATFGTATGEPILFNAAIAAAAECYPLLPLIPQGTESWERTGLKIRPKRLRVDFTIVANGLYLSSILAHVRLFVLEDKSVKNLTDIAGVRILSLLRVTQGQAGQYTGLPNAQALRINTDQFKIFKDYKCEVAKGYGQQPFGVNAYTGNQNFVSGQQAHRLSVVIPTPATLNYNLQLDDYPSNFAPFFCLGYCQPDGDSFPDNILTRIACNYVVHLDFEDA